MSLGDSLTEPSVLAALARCSASGLTIRPEELEIKAADARREP